MIQLSTHFTLEELTASEFAVRKGIDNTPPSDIVAALENTARGLERIRKLLGAPMHIHSCYRCPKLNSAIGGASQSQHMLGQAADFVAPGFGDPTDICREIADHADEIDFDQLISEGSWVHVSFTDESIPRRSILTAHFGSGGATYTKGLA